MPHFPVDLGQGCENHRQLLGSASMQQQRYEYIHLDVVYSLSRGTIATLDSTKGLLIPEEIDC